MTARVLVIEDEMAVAELVADALDLEGYEALCTTGESVLEDAAAFDPHVVLLDLMMPGIDGFEVARRLRADRATAAVPIVVMTAMHDVAARAAEVGTPYFLPKPFDIGHLVQKVREAMNATVPTPME